MEELRRESCIRGHHIYKEIWDPTVGEVVQCKREPRNAADRYSVAVTKGGVVVGHLPRRISRLCSLFLRRGGTIDCVITGARRYSVDLHQGGLEVPCSLLLKAKLKEIEKFKKLWKSSPVLIWLYGIIIVRELLVNHFVAIPNDATTSLTVN